MPSGHRGGVGGQDWQVPAALLALDIGGSAIKYARADGYQLSQRGALPGSWRDQESFLGAIAQLHGRLGAGVEAIAVSTCGELDPATGQMFTGGYWTFNSGTNLREAIAHTCGLPVSIENDANCALLAEVHSGALTDSRDGAVLVLGTGVGGALLINRRIHRGAKFHAGNASLVRVDVNSPASPLLAHVNGVGGLLADYARHAGLDDAQVDTYQLFAAAESGDGPACAALSEFGLRLGGFVYNLTLMLDLDTVAVGGGISDQPLLIAAIRDGLDRFFDASPIPVPRCRLLPCHYRNDANLIGAIYHHHNPAV